MWEKAPTSPAILDISLDLIDNLLIVSPPKEKNDGENTGSGRDRDSESDILDIDYLDFRDLDIDYLALDDEENLDFSELDMRLPGRKFL